jgi:tetratricopeptide (TPR) repeat protein
MKKIFLILLFISGIISLNGQAKDETWYFDEAEKAISKENYEYAISILKEGQGLFPLSYRIAEKIGDLYFDKELYSMALEVYGEGERLDPENGSIIYKVGSTLARLNENDEAILYYERLLDYSEFRDIAVDDLSWLYYKVHRLEESEKLLLDEIGRTFHRNLAITLGTVYSDMYNYEESKKYYLLSIEDAFHDDAMYFASVALYNLSLLEYSFYNYEQSMEYTEDSLNSLDRSSGHLARGEILQLAGRYREAEEEYLKAETMDDTPLSRIALAGLYQKTGHLEQALAYILDVQNRRDLSWMYYFGTDKNQFSMDLSHPLSLIYKAMAEKERRRLYNTPLEWIKGKIHQIEYRILSFYQEQIYKKSARTVGDHNQGKSDLNSWWAYSRASMGNTSTFMKYIELCEAFENNLTVKAVPWYLLEKGRESSDYNMLNQALSLFRSDWEVEQIMETLVHLIHLEKKSSVVLKRNRLNHLFALNSGALLQNGLALPLILEHNGTGSERKLKGYLEKSGSDVSLRADEGFAYKLIVTIEENEYSWYLLDRRGEINSEGKGSFERLNGGVYKDLVNSIVDTIYPYPF